MIAGVLSVPATEASSRGEASFVMIGRIGVLPIIAAFVIVETLAMIVPCRRARRSARPALDLVVVAAAVALVAIQAWLIVQYLEVMEWLPEGRGNEALVIGALGGFTLVSAIAASVIRARGLGNGYVALLASHWMVDEVQHWCDAPAASSGRILSAATIAVVVIAIVTVSRWRIGNAREAALRVPSSGIVPIADAAGLGAILLLLYTLPFEDVTGRVEACSRDVHASLALTLGLAVALAALGSFLFARPSTLARVAERAGLAPPSRDAWLRATALSIALLGILAAVAFVTPRSIWLATPAMIALAVAGVRDIALDVRAHRAARVRVWSLQQAQYADVVTHDLAAAGIACHLSATSVRTLLAWLGPFAPIDVWVAPAQADAARARIAAIVS